MHRRSLHFLIAAICSIAVGFGAPAAASAGCLSNSAQPTLSGGTWTGYGYMNCSTNNNGVYLLRVYLYVHSIYDGSWSWWCGLTGTNCGPATIRIENPPDGASYRTFQQNICAHVGPFIDKVKTRAVVNNLSSGQGNQHDSAYATIPQNCYP